MKVEGGIKNPNSTIKRLESSQYLPKLFENTKFHLCKPKTSFYPHFLENSRVLAMSLRCFQGFSSVFPAKLQKISKKSEKSVDFVKQTRYNEEQLNKLLGATSVLR